MFDKTKEKCMNLLKMTATCLREIYVILRDKSLTNAFKTTIVKTLNKLGYTYKNPNLK